MKIGRNQPCPCGSGKKYKKCCLDKEELESPRFSKNYFQLKGEKAEEVVYELATKSFLTDWCYKNPKWLDGKELCDILVVFDEIAIIWQIKDLKKRKDGKYSEREVQKNLNQLSGAKRKLFDLKKEIILENPRRGKEKFDPNKIKEIYLISALVGEGEDFFSFFEEFKDKKIHVLNKESIEVILNELDTIKDFVEYIKEKENFFSINNQMILVDGEKDLLAYYLTNERSFDKFREYNGIFIDEGCWEDLKNKPEYLKKHEEDKISYGWDNIINNAHTGGKGYEMIAKELARINRFERRVLSKAFLEAQILASKETKNNVFRRTIDFNGTTYLFMFLDDKRSREERQKLLWASCFVARGIHKKNIKVIGIANEMKFKPICSYDFCIIKIPEWKEKDEKEMKELQKELNILTNYKEIRIHEEEYPKK